MNKKIVILIVLVIFILIVSVSSGIFFYKNKNKNNYIIKEKNNNTVTLPQLKCSDNISAHQNSIEEAKILPENKKFSKLELNNNIKYNYLYSDSDNNKVIYLDSDFFLESAKVVEAPRLKSKEKLTKLNTEKLNDQNKLEIIKELITSGILRTYIHAFSNSCIIKTENIEGRTEYTFDSQHTYFTNSSYTEEYKMKVIIESNGDIFVEKII